jgi:pectinesterase
MVKVTRLGLLLLLCGLAACSQLGEPSPEVQEAVVSRAAEEPGSFTTITAALAAAPADQSQPYRILIKPGRYYEKLNITRPNVVLRGEGMDKTVIHFDAVASKAKHYRQDNWGTPGSATVSVNAENIHIADLTISNIFDHVANEAKAKDDPTRVAESQGVALLLDTESDRVTVEEVTLTGYQDTLFVHGNRAYFYKSVISGNVDFIFGQGTAVFDQSVIISRPRGKQFPAGSVQSYITAPSTNIHREYGLTFIDSELRREDGVPDASVTLGRPWHPTTTFEDGRYADPEAIGKAVYIRTYMDAHVNPQGWSSMRGTARDGTKSRVFTPEESRFFEYQNTGPGAAVNDKRPQLKAEQAERYTLEEILSGWQPPVNRP